MLEISLNADSLEKGLEQLLRNATDTRPMMRAIATEMQSLTEENFESESWGGENWKQSKRAANGGKTLQLSGQLAASISTKAGNDFAQIGSNKPYAAIHHLGGNAGRGRKVSLPARPYLPVSGDGNLQSGAEERMIKIAVESLKHGL